MWILTNEIEHLFENGQNRVIHFKIRTVFIMVGHWAITSRLKYCCISKKPFQNRGLLYFIRFSDVFFCIQAIKTLLLEMHTPNKKQLNTDSPTFSGRCPCITSARSRLPAMTATWYGVWLAKFSESC